MKAIVNTAPNKLELLDIPMPEPKAGQVRIQTQSVGICSTDIHMISGWKRTGFPSIPGHEWSGRIDKIGPGNNSLRTGQLCVGENIFEDGGEVGFEYPGGYAQYFCTLATNLCLLPTNFPSYLAVLIEPIAVCLRGYSHLINKNLNNPVLVFGDGPIGLIFLCILKHYGFHTVDFVGTMVNRLAIAQELGARQAINFQILQSNINSNKQILTDHYPILVEASGSSSALSSIIGMATRNSQILILGDYGQNRANFFWNDLLHKELMISGSNASAGAWDEAVKLAVGGSLPLARLITNRFSYEQYSDAINLAANHKDSCVKVVIDWV